MSAVTQVNASVDVYAFGVMMWELFVGQRPYGNMSQQKVVEEVVLRGLRPSFPVGTPLGYTQLACSCWHATATQRPTFQEIVGRLQVGGGVLVCDRLTWRLAGTCVGLCVAGQGQLCVLR